MVADRGATDYDILSAARPHGTWGMMKLAQPGDAATRSAGL